MNPLLYQTAIELQALEIPALYEHSSNQHYKHSFLLQYEDLQIRVQISTDDRYDVAPGMIRYRLQSGFFDQWNRRYSGGNERHVNISASKSPATIAADLKRRLITPKNLEELRELLADIKKTEIRNGRKIEMFNKAATLIGSSQTITNPDQTSRTIFSNKLPVGTAGVSQCHEEGKVCLELRGITIEQLEAVCKALSA